MCQISCTDSTDAEWGNLDYVLLEQGPVLALLLIAELVPTGLTAFCHEPTLVKHTKFICAVCECMVNTYIRHRSLGPFCWLIHLIHYKFCFGQYPVWCLIKGHLDNKIKSFIKRFFWHITKCVDQRRLKFRQIDFICSTTYEHAPVATAKWSPVSDQQSTKKWFTDHYLLLVNCS